MRLEYRTSNVPLNERFEYWHDVVCQRFVSADSMNENINNFDAELTSRTVGRLEISEMNAPLHAWSRRLRHIRVDGEEHYLLSIIENGAGVLEQNGRTARQNPGDISLYDTSRPFEYALSGKLKLVKIPYKYLDARVPNARELLARNLSKDARLGALLTNAVNIALEIELQDSVNNVVGEHIADSIIDLFLAVVDLCREDQNISGYRADNLEKVRAFALANLSNNALTVQSMADAGGVSARTLNRLFASMGTTPMRWVLHERLRLSKCYLQDGRARSVTEAAFMVGFSDLSHFSRTFKQYFGHTPERMLCKR